MCVELLVRSDNGVALDKIYFWLASLVMKITVIVIVIIISIKIMTAFIKYFTMCQVL